MMAASREEPLGLVRARHPTFAEIGTVTLLAAGIVATIASPLLSHLRTHVLADGPGSARLPNGFSSLFVFWWVQKCAGRWQNPFWCDWTLPPDGASLGFDTHGLAPTLLGMPLVRHVGVVGAFNLTAIALLAAVIVVVHAHLRRNFERSPVVAFPVAACFGAGAWFVARSQFGLPGLGHVFWVGALALLLYAYRWDAFDIRRGVLFGLALWACFWTSLAEFATATIAIAIAVPCLELAGLPASRTRWRAKAAFLLAALPGSVSLLFLTSRPAGVEPVLATAPLTGHVSALGAPVPLVACVLVAIALLRSRGATRRSLVALAAAGVLCLIVALDPAGLVRWLFSSLPRTFIAPSPADLMGPALFWLFTVAAAGIVQLQEALPRWGRFATAAALLALAIESRPAALHVLPVRHLEPLVQGRIDPHWRIVVVPRDRFQPVDDTFAVDLDAAVVNNVYLESRLTAAVGLRAHFPRVYRDANQIWDAEWGRELRELGVGALVLEDREMLVRLPPHLQQRVFMSGPDGVLVVLQ